MLKHNPNIVARSCFSDPVSFCLWEGGQYACVFLLDFAKSRISDVCYNFIYRTCMTVRLVRFPRFLFSQPFHLGHRVDHEVLHRMRTWHRECTPEILLLDIKLSLGRRDSQCAGSE